MYKYLDDFIFDVLLSLPLLSCFLSITFSKLCLCLDKEIKYRPSTASLCCSLIADRVVPAAWLASSCCSNINACRASCNCGTDGGFPQVQESIMRPAETGCCSSSSFCSRSSWSNFWQEGQLQPLLGPQFPSQHVHVRMLRPQ